MIIILISLGLQVNAQEQQEVLIIGTMHDVPKVVKHSYKPLLRKARRYNPDAIYVERQRPEDTLSLANYESRWFLPKGDTLRQTFVEDCRRIERLKATSVKAMSTDDFAYLRDYYMVNRDKANWYYYAYLAKYGLKGSKQPLRNENSDLTSRLAIHQDMNFIYAMDHQHETQTYTRLWNDCVAESKKDREVEVLRKLNKKSYNKAIIPAAFGGLSRYTNRVKTIEMYQLINRATFRKTDCEPCLAAGAVWDRRNAGMAANIGSQMLEYGHQKAVVIVGAGHVLGIRDELKKQFPALKVMIMEDLK